MNAKFRVGQLVEVDGQYLGEITADASAGPRFVPGHSELHYIVEVERECDRQTWEVAESRLSLVPDDGQELAQSFPIPSPEELLANPSVSFWLKGALRTAIARDCVDALHDAELLVRVLRARVDAALVEGGAL